MNGYFVLAGQNNRFEERRLCEWEFTQVTCLSVLGLLGWNRVHLLLMAVLSLS